MISSGIARLVHSYDDLNDMIDRHYLDEFSPSRLIAFMNEEESIISDINLAYNCSIITNEQRDTLTT
jgi:hypothetical protein